ncbi:1406_t:CDS:2, partial [Racocetra fulgida]
DTIMAEVFSEDLVASPETLVEDFKNLYESKERLLITADEILIQSLIDIVQSLIIQNCYMFLQRSPIRMLHFITHYKQFNELNKAYLETICKNPSLLFDSDEFLSLEENALKLILECDNLDMKENPKEFVPEVWEYMDILPKDLIKDVVHYGKTTDDNTSKGFHYKFNLLFRSNLDGHTLQAFHRRCNNKGVTIVVGRIANSSHLVGAMLSHVNYNLSDCAIGCDGAHGLSFGEGPDLHISNNKTIWKFKTKTYPLLVNITSLAVSNYEVLQ